MVTETKKKKIKKNIPTAIAHVNATFNNTIITITDTKGNTISWSSAGAEGFKGSRKSTPFAAQLAAENAGKKAKDNGVKTLEIEVRGPGSGRASALRALQSTGFIIKDDDISSYNIDELSDKTSLSNELCFLFKKQV